MHARNARVFLKLEETDNLGINAKNYIFYRKKLNSLHIKSMTDDIMRYSTENFQFIEADTSLYDHYYTCVDEMPNIQPGYYRRRVYCVEPRIYERDKFKWILLDIATMFFMLISFGILLGIIAANGYIGISLVTYFILVAWNFFQAFAIIDHNLTWARAHARCKSHANPWDFFRKRAQSKKTEKSG